MGEGGRALGRALRGGDVAVDLAQPSLPQFRLHQLQRAHDAREQIVEIVCDAAGELSDRFHFLRLAQRILGVLALGDSFRDACFQRLVEMLELFLGPLPAGNVLKQYRDLAAAGRLDAEGGEFEVAAGRDQFAFEADRLPGAQHAAIEFGPPVGLIRHHLAQLLTNHIGNAGVGGVGGVGLDMDVVGIRAVRAVEELDDAKAFVDGIEQGAVALLAVGQCALGLLALGGAGGDLGL
ncbi:hypothetical protein ES707_19695 [subsurface metagenome]